jgi:hypothetical protein
MMAATVQVLFGQVNENAHLEIPSPTKRLQPGDPTNIENELHHLNSSSDLKHITGDEVEINSDNFDMKRVEAEQRGVLLIHLA